MNKQGEKGIPYCDYTWNPITGCLHGCSYCYARRIAIRWHGGFTPTFHPNRLDEPRGVKTPSRIFVGDMGDTFGDWVPREQIEAVLKVIRETPWHTYLLLTKNPKRYQEFAIPDNAWIGTTVEDNSKRWRIDDMLQAKASIYFVSAEPLLGSLDVSRYLGDAMICPKHGRVPVSKWMTTKQCGYCLKEAPYPDAALDLERTFLPGIGLIIVGAQSGPNAVVMDEDWVRSLQDQCAEAHVAFFYKQRIENGRKVETPELDGKRYAEIPQQ